MYYLYILKSKKPGRYYVGQTSNPERRLSWHNAGKEKFARKELSWELVFHKAFETRTEARNHEGFIKRQKSRVFIEKVISGEYRFRIHCSIQSAEFPAYPRGKQKTLPKTQGTGLRPSCCALTAPVSFSWWM